MYSAARPETPDTTKFMCKLLIIEDMQILPLFSLLALCCWGQVIVATASVVLEVVESQLSQIPGFDAEIFEGFGGFVNDLIQTFLLEFISAANRPPDKLVKIMQSWSQDGLWQVDVSSLVNDFAVD